MYNFGWKNEIQNLLLQICSNSSIIVPKKKMKQIGLVLNKFYRIQFWGIILAVKFDISDFFDGNKIK